MWLKQSYEVLDSRNMIVTQLTPCCLQGGRGRKGKERGLGGHIAWWAEPLPAKFFLYGTHWLRVLLAPTPVFTPMSLLWYPGPLEGASGVAKRVRTGPGRAKVDAHQAKFQEVSPRGESDGPGS